MTDLPWELAEQVVSYLSPALIKAFVKEHGANKTIMAHAITNTRWKSMTRGVTKAQHDLLVSKGIVIGYNWLRDIAYYGDLFFLEYAIKNFPMFLHLANDVELPYLTALEITMYRLPYTAYETIKDNIKKEWRSLSAYDKGEYLCYFIKGPTPTLDWLFKNIFSKDDNVSNVSYYPHNAKNRFKIFRRMMGYGNFIDPVFKKQCQLSMGIMPKDFNFDMEEYDDGMCAYVKRTKDLDILAESIIDTFIIIENGEQVLYRQLLRPNDEFELTLGKSNIYLRYTVDTLKYILTLNSGKKLANDVLSAAYYTSPKVLEHVANIFKTLELKLILHRTKYSYKTLLKMCKSKHKASKLEKIKYCTGLRNVECDDFDYVSTFKRESIVTKNVVKTLLKMQKDHEIPNGLIEIKGTEHVLHPNDILIETPLKYTRR